MIHEVTFPSTTDLSERPVLKDDPAYPLPSPHNTSEIWGPLLIQYS